MKTLMASRSRSFSVVSPSSSRISSRTVGVVGGIDDDGDGLVILRRAAQHRRPADVDLLDRFLEFDSGFRDRRFERIEIHHHEIDRLDPVLARGGFVLLVPAQVEQAAVHFRVQSLHPAVEHLRETGEGGDAANLDPFLPQELRGATGGNDLDSLLGERAGEIDDAGFIGNGNKCAGYFHEDFFCTRT